MTRLTLRSRLVIQSLCVWNGGVLFAVGLLFLLFGDRPAGVVVAIAAWVAGGALLAASRWVGRGTGWN